MQPQNDNMGFFFMNWLFFALRNVVMHEVARSSKAGRAVFCIVG